MSEFEFIIPVVIVAGVWGFFLLTFAGNNRKFLKDDILCANDKQREEAERSMRTIHLMAPIWFIVVAIAAIFFVNSIHPFIRINLVGLALISGGLLFVYIGWAVGTLIRRDGGNLSERDAKHFSRVFKISFMGSGLLVAALGVIVCVPSLAAFFEF